MTHQDEKKRRQALVQAAADQAQQQALAAMPLPLPLLHALFDHLDVALSEGCHHDLRATQAFLADKVKHWPTVRQWLADNGGGCDCEVLANVEERWGARAAAHLMPPGVTLFPALQEVFADPQPVFKYVFFPLLTVDLASLRQGTGQVHFVSISGNGNPELDYRDDWLVFDRVRFAWDGQRYRFAGDLSFVEHMDKLPQWYAQVEQDYAQHRAQWFDGTSDPQALRQRFVQHPVPGQNADGEDVFAQLAHLAEDVSAEDYLDKLLSQHPSPDQHPSPNAASQRYRDAVLNYWVTRDAWRATGRLIQGSFYTGGYSGQDRQPYERLIASPQPGPGPHKIGTVTGYHYMDHAEDCISLWLDRPQRQVVQHFGWT